MPSLAPLTPASNKPKDTKEVESSSQQQPSSDDMNKDDAKKKKRDDEKEIARKKKRALQARERRARKKKEKEEEEARKNTKINKHDDDDDDDDDDNCKPPKKKKKMSNNNNDDNNTTQNTDGHSPKPKKDALDDDKKKVLVEEAVGRGQYIKVRLKLPTIPTQKFGFRLRDDIQNYGLPVLTALSPDSPYINSIPSNLINNYWITKLSQSEEEEVNICSSNMFVEELGKMRSSAAASGNKDDESCWIDVTFTARSPLLLSMFQYAVVTQKKSESPKKKETTPVAKLKSASQMKKKSVSKTKKKATTPVKEKKNSPVIMSATGKQLDQMTNADDTIMAAARFRVAQAELALEFASAQVRSAMNELEDARAELNRTENGSITVTAPQQQGQGKTTN